MLVLVVDDDDEIREEAIALEDSVESDLAEQLS